MLSEMSAGELQGWWSYYNVEPWGYDMENTRAGVVAASAFNSRRTKKSQAVIKPDDFFRKPDAPAASPQKMRQTMEVLMANINAKQVDNG